MDPDFLVPWEHQVCPQCLYQNPHAIWLVKYGCFEQFLHKYKEGTQPVTVVIVHETMEMVRLRPLPNYISFSGEFVMCRFKNNCKMGNRCKFPHSKAEQDAWNAKKFILNDEQCSEVISDLQDCEVWSVSPSDVCLKCYHENNSAIWLSHLTCIRPSEHGDSDTITVVVSDSQDNQQLVPVRSADHLSRLDVSRIEMCRHDPSYCPKGDRCRFAHSEEELNYWRWERAKEILDNEFPLFEGRDFEDFYELCQTYAYPDESSDVVISGVKCALTCDNYRSKYHKLVYLDDLEHTRKMARECDGEATFVVGKNRVHITEMKNGSAAMDYAIQNKASVKFSVHGYNYNGDRMFRNFNTERDSLTVEIRQNGFFRRFHPNARWKTFVHFNISHWYFWRLHRAIARADRRLIERLVMPRPKQFETSNTMRKGSYKLDHEYQLEALKKMLSCKPGAPYLLLGPFGTGKTYVLAAFVERLLSMSPENRILVCTHQNTGADKLYRSLQEHIDGIHRRALRLVPDAPGVNRNSALIQPYSCRAVHKVKVQHLAQWNVIVTTFLTALTIKDKVIKEKASLHFSHIIIDEGAQSREPEALGALVLAEPNTHIIIAGDHRQVGPKVAVYNKTAQEEGLGTSLLERLFSVYKGTRAEHSHVSTLLTNYRCHPSILMLASSLFYECTLLSRSNSKALPLAPFPVVFECSSISEGNFANFPAEDRREGLILVNRMLDYIQSDWPKSEKQTSVGLLASTRKQAARLRQMFYEECKRRKTSPENLPCRVEIIPTFIIQGEEFSAVFLSTVEPTNDKGHTRNRVRSVCNEYVFNTIITRARCLVYVTGNPFLLLHMGAEFSVNCWKEYIQRCVTCQTFILPKTKDHESIQQLPKVMNTISKKVLPLAQLDRAVSTSDVNDEILSQYMKVFHSRDEQRAAFSLVQDPKGMKYWRYEDSDSEDSDSGESSPDDVILVKLKFDSYRTGVAIPEDSSRAPLPITTLHGRRGGFQNDVVQYDIRNKCILLDRETEKAFNSQHFADSFLCRVNTRNPVEFFPLDATYPKFINLPTLTKKEREGVVMFDPASINKCPRMYNFIPMQCAVHMVFIVKFLRWRKQFNYPLGIIVGALPSGQSIESGDLLLRVAYSVPLEEQQVEFRRPLNRPSRSLANIPVYENAIAIDPEGSHDHDDALTCRRVIHTNSTSAYEIGVHITNVLKFVRKGSELDKVAAKRGCSVYRASDCCISNMLPRGLIKEATLSQGSTRDSFSVLGKVIISSGVVKKVELVKTVASRVKCERELTYNEAQAVLYGGRREDSLHVLWQVASYLRSKRLGEASHCFIAGEADEELHPEAHMLVEELMIWANKGVAALLMKKFPETTILRTQPPPNKSDLDLLVKESSSLLSTSCDLQQHVPQPLTRRYCNKFYLLESVYATILDLLDAGQVTRALHYIQFEHLHPQTAVAHALFNQIRGPSSYTACAILSDTDGAVTSHHSLRCDQYVRFTSPIRRFVDLVIQRLLHAALEGEDNPYKDTDELKKICSEMRDSEKRADAYCGDMKKLILACQLRQNPKEYSCYIKKIERGQIQLTFPDRGLKSMKIHYRALNTSGSSKVTPNSSATSLSQDSDSDSEATCQHSYEWKAKIASIKGSPAEFLVHPYLQLTPDAQDDSASVCSSSASSLNEVLSLPSDSQEEVGGDSRSSLLSGRFAELSFLVPERKVETQDDAKRAHLKEVKAKAMIKPLTCSIPHRNWKEIQKYVLLDPNDIDPENLADLFDSDDTENSLPPTDSLLRQCASSPLWIYTVHRPLQPCDVLRAQLTANFNHHTHTLTPSVQLLEVGPNLRVCIQHSSNPIECFTDRPTEKASRLDYNSINEYFRFWEQVILAEAAAGSLSDSDLMLIKDVDLQWPTLEMKVDATGHVYYQLPVPKELLTSMSKACICVTFPKQFAMSSYDFFHFSAGDLVCLRCDREETEENDGSVRCVFHMIVHDVVKAETEEGEILEVNIYLRFVSNRLNYISPEFARVVQKDKKSVKYELQLIPLTLPSRRIYQCLREMVAKQKGSGKTLAQEIALGEAKCENMKPRAVEFQLPCEKAKLATTLWSSSSSINLNPYQRKAVELALSNKFVMIQGPPGTGKSETGAHIAYALANKLKMETQGRNRGSNDPSPCVMYCGPSQQSVNVVLKVLKRCKEVQDGSLRVIRVFSKAIEIKDYQGSNYHPGVFRKANTDGECDADCAEYALHHIIRQEFPAIRETEEKFKKLKSKGKIPSDAMRHKFHRQVLNAETTILRNGVDIVLSTCNEASSRRITNSLRPVYLIVDECAMSTEPESMVPIRLASNVVLIGDHNQLQPVIQNQDAKEMGLGISLFERYAGVLEKRGRSPQAPHLLQEQYRMLHCLCKFASNEFYDGKLKTSPTVERKYSIKLDRLQEFWPKGSRKPFAFCNIVGSEDENHGGGQGGTAPVGVESKRNNKEAKKIAQIAKQLIITYGVNAEEIAALTPYSAQRAEIRKELGNFGVEDVRVKTITDSQGSEFGIVLLSTVRSKNIEDITTGDGRRMRADFGWIKANLGFITDRHQICVGITRCKYGLVIVGNETLLCYDATWRKLIQHFRDEGCFVRDGHRFPRRAQQARGRGTHRAPPPQQ